MLAGSFRALVVLIAVDQMRADYLRRYGDQWVGGFQRFDRDGVGPSREEGGDPPFPAEGPTAGVTSELRPQ